jgi:ABC-type cobalt transport system substrate-binding protein
MKRRDRLVLAVVLVLGISALAAFLAAHAGTGTDDRAAEAVEAMTGGTYEPWLHAPGVPGGDQNAPLLFGVQAGVGLALLAGCLWYWREHRSEA